MLLFFKAPQNKYYLIETKIALQKSDIDKLIWLFNGAEPIFERSIAGIFIGPRVEMITPWSTNAVEITQNMGIKDIVRIEEFLRIEKQEAYFDPMLKALYDGLNQDSLIIKHTPEPVQYIDDIKAYNDQEGLALSDDEVDYLKGVSKTVGRRLTDSEVFGFSQVNSEHCRHKIFNGTFIIDGKEKEETLFQLIKNTSREHPNKLVSAYKDNVAYVEGPKAIQFAPKTQDKPDYFELKDIDTVLSLKAETHNFPTTVEPFNGASTGTGGEIRDRMAGGKAGIPMAGTAVYMTSYPRMEGGRSWEKNTEARKWLYQTPEEILIKASNGASDFGNKFGQPLICGSLLTFEHFENLKKYGFDKVIMLAGGVGYAKKKDSLKDSPEKGDKIIVMGGDNYRIGMGGGAVSSVATGEYGNAIELNAVQRANPEMQKRVANAIRALSEADHNPIISVHDHGAGGHLNCLSELVDDKGGVIELQKLPIGDPTLSAKEIVGNESQERMGLVMKKIDMELLRNISERERAPFYVVGEITDDKQFVFKGSDGINPIDIKLEHLFGKPPRTVLTDESKPDHYKPLLYQSERFHDYLESILQLEAVACKDWLTNKVDRCVTGKVAMQQTAGTVQIPVNDVGVMALDYINHSGIATSIGHAPVAALIDPVAGSVLSIAEALTNLVWAPIKDGLHGVSLSANWMWPAKNTGENARLYRAVEAASKFSIDLGINIPTGKDSLSMTQKYPDGDVVFSPGTVIISAVGEVTDITKTVSPALKHVPDSYLIYIDFSKCPLNLGGSSFAQIIGGIGDTAPTVTDPAYFRKGFNVLQYLVSEEKILAGHDISAGGIITALLEMVFPHNDLGLDIDLTPIPEEDLIKLLFSENPGVIVQTMSNTGIEEILEENKLAYYKIGTVLNDRRFSVKATGMEKILDIDKLRDLWFKTSYLLDRKQSGEKLAKQRFENYKSQELKFSFPVSFKGELSQYHLDPNRRKSTGVKAAIMREKGINGDREMAYMLYLAGFDVKDVHMTDLIAGRETLEDINFIVFTGGFSNSDVLGSAKGWAGAFLYNEKAKKALDNYYAREDTLSLGVCNGCQLMVELGLICPDHEEKPMMQHNFSEKFECSFLNVAIPENDSILFKSLSGSRLGIWVAHGEGRFQFPYNENHYSITAKYSYQEYPGNPNGSDFGTAAIASTDGRHMVIMPHLERSFFPWQWGHYPETRPNDEVTPWIEAFVNAKKWVERGANHKQ